MKKNMLRASNIRHWPRLDIIPVVHLTHAKLVMADPGDVLDLLNPSQFDESEWIGKG
jgi:hypothetical protein